MTRVAESTPAVDQTPPTRIRTVLPAMSSEAGIRVRPAIKVIESTRVVDEVVKGSARVAHSP
jgi:hypothetical protein